MHPPRLAAALAILFAATPALAQPSETPADPAPAPTVEASAELTIAPPQQSDTDVAPAVENVEPSPATDTVPPARTAAVSSAPSMVEPIDVVAPPAPAPTPIEAATAGDAAAGRAYLFPTALTGPKGTGTVELTFPAYPVGGMLVGTYSITDRIEIGAGGIFAFEADDGAAIGVLTAKAQVVRGKRGALAVQVKHVSVPDEDDDATFYSVVGSACLGENCKALVSGHLTFLPLDRYVYDEYGGSEGTEVHVMPGMSLVTGGRTKLVVDAVWIDDEDDVVFGVYTGLRFARPTWAFDVGLAAGGEDGDVEAIPVPLGALSGRF